MLDNGEPCKCVSGFNVRLIRKITPRILTSSRWIVPQSDVHIGWQPLAGYLQAEMHPAIYGSSKYGSCYSGQLSSLLLSPISYLPIYLPMYLSACLPALLPNLLPDFPRYIPMALIVISSEYIAVHRPTFDSKYSLYKRIYGDRIFIFKKILFERHNGKKIRWFRQLRACCDYYNCYKYKTVYIIFLSYL